MAGVALYASLFEPGVSGAAECPASSRSSAGRGTRRSSESDDSSGWGESASSFTLPGTGDMASVALIPLTSSQARRPSICGIHLTSHRSGPVLLNVLHHLDLPQAVALVAPRKVTIRVAGETARAVWE